MKPEASPRPRKRIKRRPGLRFEIPGVDACGLIVGFEGYCPLSYFFPFAYQDLDDSLVRPENAILIAVHNIRIFLDEDIQYSMLESFDAAMWPRPVYVSSTKADQPPCYADTIQVLEGSWFAPLGLPWDPVKTPLGYTTDHSAIPMSFIRVRLARILESGDVNMGRRYRVKDAKPDGGELLRAYLRKHGRPN